MKMRLVSLSLAILLGFLRCSSGENDGAGPDEGLKTISVPLVNHKNLTYTTVLKVGTPHQEFTVMLDTLGSTWLIAYFCAKGEPCYGHKMFQWTESSSYSTEWVDGVVEFGSGNITGVESLDTHELGGVDIGKVFFLNGIGFHVPSFVHEPFDGVFGLRLGPHSALSEMARSGVIGKPWLGLYFSPEENVLGEALFGGASKSHYDGSLGFVEAFGDAFQFNIDGYEVGPLKKMLPPEDSRARLALTEPFTGGPAGDIQSLNTMLGGRKVEGGRYELRCEADSPPLVFVIGSKEIEFKSGDYQIKVDEPSGTRCYSGFMEAGEMHNATWHLGLLFLRRVYTVLEAPLEPSGHGRVGFASVRLPA
ncbi:lysosomal aspartic protease-like isoform X2 [Amblyomma americanum]